MAPTRPPGHSLIGSPLDWHSRRPIGQAHGKVVLPSIDQLSGGCQRDRPVEQIALGSGHAHYLGSDPNSLQWKCATSERAAPSRLETARLTRNRTNLRMSASESTQSVNTAPTTRSLRYQPTKSTLRKQPRRARNTATAAESSMRLRSSAKGLK